MAIRRVEQEFEATLAAAGAQKVTGKVEGKRYGNGGDALRVRVRDLDDVALDHPLQLFINGVAVGDVERTRNKAELRLDSRQGHSLPEVGAGDRAEIRSGTLVLAHGTFVED